MARTFNIEIFNGTINSNTTYYSAPEYNETLGRADDLILQLIVDSVPSTAVIDAQYQTSNDGGQNANLWKDVTGLKPSISATTANCPAIDMKRSSPADALGAFGRVAVSTSSSGSGFTVRVIACGRVQS
jgi:hypothetical protein